MQPTLSLIICTHNPRPDYLRRTLDGLREQTLPLDQWEFLLVDNASTSPLADSWDLSWHPRARHVREEEVGLTAARLRGIKEFRGELLIFVDDDNVLAPDFLEQAAAIMSRHPHLGVFGAGVLEPEFEVQPPADLLPRLSLLALRTVPRVLWTNNIKDTDCVPWGAGLCVSRPVAVAFQELIARLNVTVVLGRRGQQLFSGEDDVFSWASVGTGQGFGIFPELRIKHLIPARRVNREYYLRLVQDHAFSHGVLDCLLSGDKPRLMGWFDYVHLIGHAIRNGPFSMRCQWAGLRGQHRAARFIAEHRLRSLENVPKMSPQSTVHSPDSGLRTQDSGLSPTGLRTPDSR